MDTARAGWCPSCQVREQNLQQHLLSLHHPKYIVTYANSDACDVIVRDEQGRIHCLRCGAYFPYKHSLQDHMRQRCKHKNPAEKPTIRPAAENPPKPSSTRSSKWQKIPRPDSVGVKGKSNPQVKWVAAQQPAKAPAQHLAKERTKKGAEAPTQQLAKVRTKRPAEVPTQQLAEASTQQPVGASTRQLVEVASSSVSQAPLGTIIGLIFEEVPSSLMSLDPDSEDEKEADMDLDELEDSI